MTQLEDTIPIHPYNIMRSVDIIVALRMFQPQNHTAKVCSRADQISDG